MASSSLTYAIIDIDMDIDIVTYRRFTEMPRDVYNVCRQMGYQCHFRGHLRKHRNLVTGRLEYRLRSALIIYAGERIVGWAALYDIDTYQYPSVSVWVKTVDRGNGYGTKLITEAYRRWNKYNPTVYHKVAMLWSELQGK